MYFFNQHWRCKLPNEIKHEEHVRVWYKKAFIHWRLSTTQCNPHILWLRLYLTPDALYGSVLNREMCYKMYICFTWPTAHQMMSRCFHSINLKIVIFSSSSGRLFILIWYFSLLKSYAIVVNFPDLNYHNTNTMNIFCQYYVSY